MKTFGIVGATHFCAAFSACPVSAAVSVRDYLALPGKQRATYSESTPAYDELRDCLLRHSERSLLMSVVSFERAMATLRASSAFWALTGFYYSAFFAAHAILGMFGCWIGGQKKWIEVQDTAPGGQTLALRHKAYDASASGPHQLLWHAFYSASGGLTSWVTPKAAVALVPVNSQLNWLIDTRNTINYGSWEAMKMTSDFAGQFDAAKIPTCFPGKLLTVITVASAFIECMRELALQLTLKTDIVAPSASRLDWIADNILVDQDPAIAAYRIGHHTSLAF